MKRSQIVAQLMNEGFSEKTLAQLNDKQLNGLAERILGEAITTTAKALSKSPDLQNLAKTQDIKLVGETETNEELKGNQKKIDKNHNGKIDAQDFKILKGQKKKKEVKEEKPSAGLSKEKKSEVVKKAKKGEDIGKKGKGFEKIADKASEKYGSKEKGEKVAAAAMWKNIKRENTEVKSWVKGLVENEKFHSFTSKNEIMDLIQTKLTESEKHEYGPNVKTGHNGLPEFMTYDAIKSSAPTTKPAPTKPKVEPGTKPKTPYEPGPGKNPKPKAGLRNLPENEVMELDHQELKTSERFEALRTALAKNTNVSVAYVKKDGTVRHMLVKRYMSSYVPSEREKSEKQMNINQNHDVKRVIDVNAYIKGLKETNGDKELAAKKAWRTINLRDVLGFMVKGQFMDLRDENEIQQRFGDEVNNSLTKSMVNAMQAAENNAEMEVA
jgi:hypothetical protein